MSATNGHSEGNDPLMLRLVSLVSRVNDALRDSYEEQRRCSGLLAQVVSAVERLETSTDRLREVVGGIGHDVEEVRKDQTDPRMRIPSEVQVQPSKNASGGALVHAARLAEHMPASWAGGLLKLGVSSGLGAALLRAIQWITTGH